LAVFEGGVDHLLRYAVGARRSVRRRRRSRDRRHIAAASSYQRTAERSIPRSRRRVASGDRNDDHPATGALRQEIGLPVEQLQGAGADRAETRDSNLQRRFHDNDGSLRRETVFDKISAASPQRLNILFALPTPMPGPR